MSSNTRTCFAYVLVFSVQIVFAAYQIMTKAAFSGNNINPFSFAFIRVLGTSVVLITITCSVPSSRRSVARAFCIGDVSHFIVLGISMVANVLGLILALRYASSGTVAILQVLRPVFAAVISWLIGVETFSAHMLMGLLVCVTGASAVARDGAAIAKPGESVYLGVFFVCVHSAGQAMYVAWQPVLAKDGYSTFAINSGAFVVATAMLGLCLLIPPTSLHEGLWWDNSNFFLVLTAYSIIMVGAYSYAAMGWAANEIGGTAVMLFLLLQAIMTAWSGAIFLHEPVGRVQMYGCFLILCGLCIFIYGKQERREKADDLAETAFP